MKMNLLAVAAALALASFGANAVDNPATTTFTVSATVVDSCTVTAENLAFGNYDPLPGAVADSTADIAVICSMSTEYEVGLSGPASRQMTHANETDTLDYSLSTLADQSLNWGNNEGVDTDSGTGNGAAQTHRVYGQILANQQAALTGVYSDTVTVSVYY